MSEQTSTTPAEPEDFDTTPEGEVAEDQTETPEGEVAEIEEDQTFEIPEDMDDEFVQRSWHRAFDAIVAHNDLAAKLKASETSASQVSEFLKDSTEPVVVTLREEIDRLQKEVNDKRAAAKDKIREEFFGGKGLSDEEKTKTETDMAEFAAKATRYTDVGSEDYDGFAETLPELAKVSKSRATTGGARTGQSQGTKRMRVYAVIVDGKDYGNFTEAKAQIEKRLGYSVEMNDIHNAYLNVAGPEGSPVKTYADAADDVSFEFEGLQMKVEKEIQGTRVKAAKED